MSRWPNVSRGAGRRHFYLAHALHLREVSKIQVGCGAGILVLWQGSSFERGHDGYGHADVFSRALAWSRA